MKTYEPNLTTIPIERSIDRFIRDVSTCWLLDDARRSGCGRCGTCRRDERDDDQLDRPELQSTARFFFFFFFFCFVFVFVFFAVGRFGFAYRPTFGFFSFV
jgi:hypothetical protein